MLDKCPCKSGRGPYRLFDQDNIRGSPGACDRGRAHWILTQECTIDDSKARRELGYAPIVSREQGLAELRQSARAA
jgi:hypothetical protein